MPSPHPRETIRRASAGLSPTRAAAAMVMLLAAVAVYGVVASTGFSYARLEVSGANLTQRAQVEAAIADARGRNLFGLHTGSLEAALVALPAVRDANVDVVLPETLAVTLHERQPLLVWQIGARRYVADEEGGLFALLADDPPPSSAALPVIEDQRASSVGLSVGQRLSPVDLDAATRLASLRPVDVGSKARSLAVLVTDDNGFVLRARPDGWSAVFGFYTPTLRTTTLIPGQVRLLRSLVTGQEATVDRVVLASETDGTYFARETPKPSPKPSAKASGRPATRSTPRPTAEPAARPTPKPTARPTPKPTRRPAATASPSAKATSKPTPKPSPRPAKATPEPSAARSSTP